MVRNTKFNSGFTMIEIIFSMVIFLVLYFSVAFLITTVAKNSYDTRYSFIATTIAQKRFEEIKAIKEITEGYRNYEYENFVIEEKIIKVEEYKCPVYKIMINVYKDDRMLEKLEGLKVLDNW